MKRFYFLSLGLFFTCIAAAQSSAKKYVLIEHFTNSRCSVCASRNPAFYSLIGQAQYAPDIHHISIHPSFPYSNCVFHQANPTENSEWTSQYNIPGTPRVALNGRLMPSGSQLLRQDSLVKYIGQTSPVALQVTMTGTGANRSAQIKVKTLGAVPTGNYKLYVAVAEKTINQTTPNGESVHRDVFRDMLTAVDGQAINLPAQGQSADFNFNFSINNNWNSSEIYVLAFIKENSTKLTLNSGTNLDPQTVDVQALPTQTLTLAPNPAQETTYAQLPSDESARSVVVIGQDGRILYQDEVVQGNLVMIPTAALPAGVYWVHIQGKQSVYLGKLLK